MSEEPNTTPSHFEALAASVESLVQLCPDVHGPLQVVREGIRQLDELSRSEPGSDPTLAFAAGTALALVQYQASKAADAYTERCMQSLRAAALLACRPEPDAHDHIGPINVEGAHPYCERCDRKVTW